jgi:hypothetical protein
MSSQPKRILVVANETVGGRALIDAIVRHAEQAKADGRPVEVHVVCPQNQPKKGFVVYDETVREAAENRLRTTIAQLREVDIEAQGEVMDPDPYAATMDAFNSYGADCVLISTHPDTRSGWLRRDLIDRVRDATGAEVEHIVVDLDADRKLATRTLVVANQTVGGEPLIGLLRGKAEEGPHNFIVVCPQGGSPDGGGAHQRLAHTLERLREAGLEAIGQVMDPDPFTAIQNALQFYAVDEIVISTFPATRSGWMRADLVERVQAATSVPVEHVVVNPSEAKEGVPG